MGGIRTSVAMCTYDGADFLLQQLESIQRQSVAVDEVVICDDRSRDDTQQIVDVFSKEHPGLVRFFRNDRNVGYIQNFSQALSRCSGDIIFLSDQDDVWLPTKVEKILGAFAQHQDIGVVASAATVTDRNLKPTGRDLMPFHASHSRQANTFSARYQRSFLVGCPLAMRATLMPLIMPIPPSWGHDNWICLVASLFSKAYSIPEPLMYYRRHPGSAGLNDRLDGAGWGQFAAAYKKSAGLDYRKDWEQWQAIHDRLVVMLDSDERSSALDGADSKIREALQEIGARVNFSWRRLRVTAIPRLLRVFGVLHLLFSGQYAEFASGWRSVAKDLLTE